MRSGQTVLIVILIMVIALTVGLSMISRTSTDVRMTGQFEDSARAFSAAEAGVEQALKNNTSSSFNMPDGTQVVANFQPISGTAAVYSVPAASTRVGSVATVFLTGHAADGTLDFSSAYAQPSVTICYTAAGAGTPAVEAIVYYKTGTTYQLFRWATDPLPSTDRGQFNGFAAQAELAGACGLSGTVYAFPMTVIPVAGALPAFVRIRAYYADATVAVAPINGASLPRQGDQIDASAVVAGGVTRKITVIRQYRAPASYFDHVIYGQNAFVQ
jgi:hypothetical protein